MRIAIPVSKIHENTPPGEGLSIAEGRGEFKNNIMAKQQLKTENVIDIATGELIQQMDSYNVRSQQTWEYKKSTKKEGLDMTIPDQTMSLREIVEKHSRGMEINGQKTAIFDEAETASGINPLTLDLIDLQELKILNNEQIINLREQAKIEISNRKSLADAARTEEQAEIAERVHILNQKRYGDKSTGTEPKN